MTKAGYEKDWGPYAMRIEKRKIGPEWSVLREARESHFNELFDVKKEDRVLDGGCGHGDYSLFALKKGARVWGFDTSLEMVRCTDSLVNNAGYQMEAITESSVLSIPFPDDRFDVVFCLAVLDHLGAADRVTALHELKRVLAPGGSLYLDVPNKHAFHWRLAFEIMRFAGMYPKGEIHFFTPFEIKRMVETMGFVVSKTLGLTISPPFSGIYTTDIRRITFLPPEIIVKLDEMYLSIEKSLRRIPFFKQFCWHYFLKAEKKD